MEQQIFVENIKCGGCANSISKALQVLPGVSDVRVSVEESCVTFVADDDLREVVTTKLTQLGYPPVNSAQGLASLKAKAKSLVSCAVGKLDA